MNQCVVCLGSEVVEVVHVRGQVCRLLGALLTVLGEALVLVIGGTLLIVDHVAYGSVEGLAFLSHH